MDMIDQTVEFSLVRRVCLHLYLSVIFSPSFWPPVALAWLPTLGQAGSQSTKSWSSTKALCDKKFEDEDITHSYTTKKKQKRLQKIREKEFFFRKIRFSEH